MALKGFALTYDFGDAAAEARACRTDCALFDFSFLECARLEGRRARSVLEAFTGRSMVALRQNEILYALRTGPTGEVATDWTVWRTGAEGFEVMSGRREDVLDLLACAGPGVEVVDATMGRAVFAVQGPGALDVLCKLGDVRPIEFLRYFTFGRAQLAGIACTIGRLGFTGEAGFEIVVERRNASELWQVLSARAAPAGFIAADLLRIEAGFVLFTNEFRLPVSAREAGLGKFGRPPDQQRPKIRLVSFRAKADQLSYPWQPSHDLQRPLGPGTIAVTSACKSVVADGILGLGYVATGTAPGTALKDTSGTFRDIHLTSKPFYDIAKRRPRAPWR